jgi:hypothetical protein
MIGGTSLSQPRDIAGAVCMAFAALLIGCQAPAGPTAQMNPRADEQLRAMCQTLKSAQQFSVRVRIASEDLLVNGRPVQSATERLIQVRRPDRLAIDLRSNVLQERIGFDGRALTMLRLHRNAYAVIEARGTLDALVNELRHTWHLRVPLMDFLAAEPYERLLANTTAVRYFGEEHVAGRACHRIALERADGEWQIWIDAADRLPRQVTIVPADRSVAAPRRAAFYDWDLAQRASELAFSVPLPDGSYEVEAIDFFGLP